MHAERTQYAFTISQRHRGIFLVHMADVTRDVEEWDALPTLAAAKRRCAEWVDRKRLPWRQYNDTAWMAEVELDV